MRAELPRGGPRHPIRAVGAVLVGVVVAVPLSACGSDDRPPAATRTAASRPAPPVLDAAGIAAAFDRLGAELQRGERIFTLSLRPTEVVAEVARRANGPGRYLSLPVRGAKNVQPARRVLGDVPGPRLQDIDRQGPVRLIAAAQRGRGPAASSALPGAIDLKNAEQYDRRATWQLSFASGGTGWIGDEHGRHVLSTDDRAPAPEPGEEGPARAPAAVNATSLIRGSNLRRALAALRRVDPRGVLTYLDLEPDVVRVDLTTGRRVTDYEIDPAFGVTPGSANRAAPDEVATPASTPDPGVPQRALRTIGRRLRADASRYVGDVSYLEPDADGSPASWSITTEVPDRGRQTWRISADGSTVERSGSGTGR